jgi:hypothetical protein
MKVLFLDESGDHNLLKIDPQYPLFVLGGVIMDQGYAEDELPREMDAFNASSSAGATSFCTRPTSTGTRTGSSV